ncbi:MAG: type III-A CRISPR-associated protein Csm2 [Bacteroidales bacterium]|nr:type III-A CRISPR-associated protein Csm2 [Bacteroidales bacterium]
MEKYPAQRFEKNWIYSPITEEIVKWTDSFSSYLTKKEEYINPLSTSQLRKFFGELKRIESNFKEKKCDLPMLKPMLAYAVGRDKNERGRNKTKIKEFSEEINKGLDAIRNDDNIEKDFKNFLKIFESIVAYHKYHGGK